MKRIKDEFLDILAQRVKFLHQKKALEIGCGDGWRSLGLARRCKSLYAIDPDPANVELAQSRAISNATFAQGTVEKLEFEDDVFDVVVFTLSLHHVVPDLMSTAIDEAVRVVKKDGHIVFLEPGTNGTFFDAEIEFDACDGDERPQKRAAYQAIRSHEKIQLVTKIPDETVFRFDSLEDFVTTMSPNRKLPEILALLRKNNFTLRAERRIDICSVR